MLCKNVVYFNINPFRDYLDSLIFIVPFSHESAGKSAINSICCMLTNGFCLIGKRLSLVCRRRIKVEWNGKNRGSSPSPFFPMYI